MEITLLQGIIITLVVMVLVVDRHLEVLFLFRPIIVCPIVGAILGDLNTGLVAGGMVELAFAGIAGIGGASVPEALLTSVMTVVFAHITGNNVATSLALAYPFGVLLQFLWTVRNTAFVSFNGPAERYAEEGNIRGLFKLCFYGIVLTSIATGILTFLSVYAAQEPLKALVEAMPDWLINGFQVAGGLLPAVGFAMLLRVTLKARYVPYLLAGFLFATFIQIDNVLPVAIMGVAFALMEYFRSGEKEVAVASSGNGGEASGI